jgi:hypothetical protein
MRRPWYPGTGILLVGQVAAVGLAVGVLSGQPIRWWTIGLDLVGAVTIGVTWWWIWSRRHRRWAQMPHAVRPRYGTLHRADGTELSLVFHPDPDRPGNFLGRDAGSEDMVVLRRGDTMSVDAMAAGQSAQLAVDPTR